MHTRVVSIFVKDHKVCLQKEPKIVSKGHLPSITADMIIERDSKYASHLGIVIQYYNVMFGNTNTANRTSA